MNLWHPHADEKKYVFSLPYSSAPWRGCVYGLDAPLLLGIYSSMLGVEMVTLTC